MRRRQDPALVDQCAAAEVAAASFDGHQPREFTWPSPFAAHYPGGGAAQSAGNVRHCQTQNTFIHQQSQHSLPEIALHRA